MFISQKPLNPPPPLSPSPEPTTPLPNNIPLPVVHTVSSFPARSGRHYFELDPTEEEDGNQMFSCEICSKVFVKQGTLEIHRRTHTGEKPYKCPVCAQTFSFSIQFNIHMRTHKTEGPHECSKCGKVFPFYSALVRHLPLHTKKYLKCTLCGKFFIGPMHLESHMVKRHNQIKEGVPSFDCTVCARTYKTKKGLRCHMKSHPDDDDTPYGCYMCDKSFSDEDRLKEHLEIHRKQTSDEGPHACPDPECDQELPTLQELNSHLQDHTEKQCYCCDVCQTFFSPEELFEQHLKSHENNHENNSAGPDGNNGSRSRKNNNFNPIHHPSWEKSAVGADDQEDQDLKPSNIFNNINDFNNFHSAGEFLENSGANNNNNESNNYSMESYVSSSDLKIGNHNNNVLVPNESSAVFDVKIANNNKTCQQCKFICGSLEDLCCHYNLWHNLPTVHLTRINSIKKE